MEIRIISEGNWTMTTSEERDDWGGNRGEEGGFRSII